MQATCCMTRNRPIATLFMTMVVKAPCAPADDRYNRPNIRTRLYGHSLHQFRSLQLQHMA